MGELGGGCTISEYLLTVHKISKYLQILGRVWSRPRLRGEGELGRTRAKQFSKYILHCID